MVEGIYDRKEYECYVGHEEMLGRVIVERGIPGQGSWVVRIFGMRVQKKKKKRHDPGRWSCLKNESLGSEVVLGKNGLGSWRMEKCSSGQSSRGDQGLKGVRELQAGELKEGRDRTGGSFGRCVLNNGLKGAEVLWGRIMGRG